MECPICFHEDCDALSTCVHCTKSICLTCYERLHNELCPFCRHPYASSSSSPSSSSRSTSPITVPRMSYPPSSSYDPHGYAASYPPSTLVHPIPYWESSRTQLRKFRREQKKYFHDLQKARNAEMSRLHNHRLVQDRVMMPTRHARRRHAFSLDDYDLF